MPRCQRGRIVWPGCERVAKVGWWGSGGVATRSLPSSPSQSYGAAFAFAAGAAFLAGVFFLVAAFFGAACAGGTVGEKDAWRIACAAPRQGKYSVGKGPLMRVTKPRTDHACHARMLLPFWRKPFWLKPSSAPPFSSAPPSYGRGPSTPWPWQRSAEGNTCSCEGEKRTQCIYACVEGGGASCGCGISRRRPERRLWVGIAGRRLRVGNRGRGRNARGGGGQ